MYEEKEYRGNTKIYTWNKIFILPYRTHNSLCSISYGGTSTTGIYKQADKYTVLFLYIKWWFCSDNWQSARWRPSNGAVAVHLIQQYCSGPHAEVLQSWADSELLPASCAWVFHAWASCISTNRWILLYTLDNQKQVWNILTIISLCRLFLFGKKRYLGTLSSNVPCWLQADRVGLIRW